MNQDNNQNNNQETGDAGFSASLRDLAAQSARHTDETLEAELMALMLSTAGQFDTLRPMVTDKENYDRLIRAVSESTANNENISQLKERLTKDDGLLSMGLTAARLLKVF